MEAKRRYSATPRLAEVLRDRERSASWLARKVKVSTSLMGFVVNNQRTLSQDKAMLVAAVLGKELDDLFTATDVREFAPLVASHEMAVAS